MEEKKIKIPSEVVCVVSIVLLSLAVAIMTVADLGLSMIVSPAFILSEKVSFLTFGQSEYVLQAIFFVIFCIIIKKIKPVYLCSFLNCVVYGAVLDLWRMLPVFSATPSMPVRLCLFVVGMVLTSFSVALAVNTYFYPQVYDFIVKALSAHFRVPLAKFKTGVDLFLLCLSITMTLLMFGKFVGVWYGTIVIALVNGTLIGFFDKLFKKHLLIYPLFPKLEKIFEI